MIGLLDPDAGIPTDRLPAPNIVANHRLQSGWADEARLKTLVHHSVARVGRLDNPAQFARQPLDRFSRRSRWRQN
jgi:hypothetical protein